MVLYLIIAAAAAAWTAVHYQLSHPVTDMDRHLSAVDAELDDKEFFVALL